MSKRLRTILPAAILLGMGLLWVLLGPESVREGRCRLVRKKADPESPLMGLAIRSITPLEAKPDSARDLPAGFGQPRYYTIDSGDKPILMAADYSQKLVRLCVDTDGDGVLSEERCFTARVSEKTPVSGSRQRLGPISLISRDRAGRTNDGFYVNCFREDARGLLIPFPASFRTGKLRLAGRTYQVALVDGDYDGVFKSILSLPLGNRTVARPGCDLFAIDLNHNGEFESSLRDRSEVMPLGRLVKVGDDYYAIDTVSDGTRLVLSKAEPQLGTLNVDANDASVAVRLWSDAADQHLLQSCDRHLPAGQYATIYAVLTIKDAAGDIWTLSSFTPGFTAACMGSLDFFTIEPGETTSIKIGPPFVIKTHLQRWGYGAVVGIDPVIVGCAGEQYSPAFLRNGKRAGPIPFKIVDEKGTVLLSDKVGYT